jgi:thiol:disulfide interchange protein DsbD
MKLKLVVLLLLIKGILFAFSDGGVLSADKAFKTKIDTDKSLIHTKIELAKGIYIYDEKLKYKIIEPKKLILNKHLKIPKPVKHDEFIVHFKEVDVDIPLKLIKKKVGNNPFKLQIEYQGCSTKGLCYPPKKTTVAFDKNGNLVKEKITKPKNDEAVWGIEPAKEKKSQQPFVQTKTKPLPNSDIDEKNSKKIDKDQAINSTSSKELNDEDKILDLLKHRSFFAVLGLFFILGLGLSLTPCIFPMIPILSSIITLESKQSKNMNAKRGFILSLVYIVASALVYAVAGVISAIFGANILSALQNPWVIVTFSLIFVALAFSMFGYYEIQLPKTLQNFANRKSEESKGGGFVGVAIMGALSALIVGPCVAPPLAAALIFIGQTGDVLLGGLALFLLGLGMGTPLLLIGLGGGKFMPKPGGWMTKISYVFGVVMLGIAISFLSRIIPEWASMLLWSILFIASGVYAGALEPFKEGASGLYKFVKVIAVILLAYGLILFFATFTGGKSPLDPLKNLHTQNIGSSNLNARVSNSFEIVKSQKELAESVAKAKKPVLIDFSAKWCAACKELEEETFSDKRVQDLMSRFKLIRVDVTDNSDEDKKLQKTFGIVGPPAIIFYDLKKNELKDLKVVGFKEPAKFIQILKKALER